MARRRLRESERSFCSGLSFLSSTPARSASIWRAPRLSVFSISSTKVKTSPWRSHPKQYQVCIWGLTLKLGLSSWWNGHRPHNSLLRLVRRRCSWTTLTRSILALTSAKASSVAWGDIYLSIVGRSGFGHCAGCECGSAEAKAEQYRPRDVEKDPGDSGHKLKPRSGDDR